MSAAFAQTGAVRTQHDACRGTRHRFAGWRWRLGRRALQPPEAARSGRAPGTERSARAPVTPPARQTWHSPTPSLTLTGPASWTASGRARARRAPRRRGTVCATRRFSSPAARGPARRVERGGRQGLLACRGRRRIERGARQGGGPRSPEPVASTFLARRWTPSPESQSGCSATSRHAKRHVVGARWTLVDRPTGHRCGRRRTRRQRSGPRCWNPFCSERPVQVGSEAHQDDRSLVRARRRGCRRPAHDGVIADVPVRQQVGEPGIDVETE